MKRLHQKHFEDHHCYRENFSLRRVISSLVLHLAQRPQLLWRQDEFAKPSAVRKQAIVTRVPLLLAEIEQKGLQLSFRTEVNLSAIEVAED